MQYVKHNLINTKLSILTITLMIENPSVNDDLSDRSDKITTIHLFVLGKLLWSNLLSQYLFVSFHKSF